MEGCESLIPGLKALVDRASDLGVENIVVGMAHRGRLNVLGNVLRKPLAQIFHEFEHGVGVNQKEYDEWGASGDVKYHLGTSCERPTSNGKTVRTQCPLSSAFPHLWLWSLHMMIKIGPCF